MRSNEQSMRHQQECVCNTRKERTRTAHAACSCCKISRCASLNTPAVVVVALEAPATLAPAFALAATTASQRARTRVATSRQKAWCASRRLICTANRSRSAVTVDVSAFAADNNALAATPPSPAIDALICGSTDADFNEASNAA